MPRDHVGL